MLASKLIQLEQTIEREKKYQLFNRSSDKTRTELQIQTLLPKPRPVPYRPAGPRVPEAIVEDRAKQASPELWATARWAKAREAEEQQKRAMEALSPQTHELIAQAKVVTTQRVVPVRPALSRPFFSISWPTR